MATNALGEDKADKPNAVERTANRAAKFTEKTAKRAGKFVERTATKVDKAVRKAVE